MTLHWVHPHTEPYTVLLDGLQNGNLLFIHDRLSLFFSAKWRLGQNSRPSSSFQKKIGSSTKMYIMDIHRLYLIFVFFGGGNFCHYHCHNLKDNYCVCNSRCPIVLSHLHAASSVHFRDAKTNI